MSNPYLERVDQWYAMASKGHMPGLLYDEEIAKLGMTRADNPLDATNDTTWFHTDYAQECFSWLHYQDTMFRLVAQTPMSKTGRYVMTGVATNRASGIAEMGALPDTGHPSVEQGTVPIKCIDSAVEISTQAQIRDLMGESFGGLWQALKQDRLEDLRDRLDAMMLADPDTVAGNNADSHARFAGSKAWEDSALLDAGDLDFMGFDRSSATTYDAGHTKIGSTPGTDETLTMAMIEDAISDIKAASGVRPQFIVTGYDTMRRIKRLSDDYYRMEKVNVSFSVNGVQVTGQDTNWHAAAVDGIPVFENSNVQKDTISRIHLCNCQPKGNLGPRLRFEVARPMTYAEFGNPVVLDAHKTKGNYAIFGEFVCMDPKAQGIILELK